MSDEETKQCICALGDQCLEDAELGSEMCADCTEWCVEE